MRERNEQEEIRFGKLKELREQGEAYPNDVRLNATSKAIVADAAKEPEEAERFTIAGRMVACRMMGKAAFIHLQDRDGRAQSYVRKNDVGDDAYAAFKAFDIGDLVEVSGYVFVTKTGEPTLYAESIRLLTKSLIPLPEKWHGLADVDSRYRYRYVDLIANPEVADVFRKRATIINYIRNFLDNRDYVEVETPVLSNVASGAIAKPFTSHYNALGADMFLRIALELPLKKLIVGGLERVYELGKVFRNEGLSKKHNPEFTMIEFYEAYATFTDLMDLTEKLICGLAEKVCGSNKITFAESEIDFSGPWKRISMKDSIHEIGGVSKDHDLDDLETLKKVAAENKIELSEPADWGHCLEDLWGELVEGKIADPVFITHHPFSISPFARKNAEDSRITDRFELIIAGMEIANAFSELNDPEDQQQRLQAQIDKKAGGAEEVADMDDDYIKALEYGMPPTGGEGIGIDRLVMLLTNSHTIREVVLFPQLKQLAPVTSNEEE